MVKRPLFWAGVCLTAVLACVFAAGAEEYLPRGRTDPPLQYEEGTKLTLTGKVADCDRMPEGARLFLDHIRIISDNNSASAIHSVDQSYQIILYTDEKQVLPGDVLTVSGKCGNFEPASNPGQFDAREYYSAKKVLFTLKSPAISGVRTGAPTWKRMLFALKFRLCGSYEEILGKEQAAVLSAISLGERALLEDARKDLYQEGGIAHILAISGLHISLLGMGIYRLLRRCLVPVPAAAGLAGVFLVSYIEMAGWSASSARACVMFLLWLGAQVSGRAFDRLTALAAAAVLLLLTEPGILTQAAFQLSFLSLLSLLLLADGLGRLLAVRSKAGKALHAALALQAGMLPCTLYFFYQISPWSMAVNLVVIPLMPLIMVTGLVGGLAGIFSIQAGMLFSAPCHYLLLLMDGLCRMESRLPGAVLVCGRPDPGRILLYYMVLGAVSLTAAYLCRAGEGQAPRNEARILWGGALAACFFLMQPARPARMEVTCLDVGQGDGILLRTPDGQTAMIDGGSSSESEVWEYRISSAVKYYGVRTIRWWFVSHSDQDHISGLQEYLEEYETNLAGGNTHGVTLKNLVLPVTKERDEVLEELRETARQKGIRVYTAQRGDTVKGGPAKAGGGADRQKGEEAWILACLAPDENSLTGDANQDSLVLRLQFGQFRMLFTGDLEEEGERQLTRSGEDLASDVLKVGHHGSKNGSSEPFLEKVNPRLSVISRGLDNHYGHPSPETVKRLEQAGSRILDTALQGAVTIGSDGTDFTAEFRF